MEDSPTLRDVLMAVGPSFLERAGLPVHVRRVFHRLALCRTGGLGFHLVQCDRCSDVHWRPRACQDRHCPGCGVAAGKQWVELREQDLLDVPYFHVVFTLPSELRALALANQELVYGLLMRVSKEVLHRFAADPKFLGGVPAVLQVLHTWDRKLDFHPHVHTVISGAGWHPTQGLVRGRGGKHFLFPVKALSVAFRGQLLAELQQLRDQGRLRYRGGAAELEPQVLWEGTVSALYGKRWQVYAKRPFGGPRQVLRYLARYTHRTAISNRRIERLQDGRVTFRHRVRSGSKGWKHRTLSQESFVRLFSCHILPKGFHRLRQSGLLAHAYRERLQQAQVESGLEPTAPRLELEKPTLTCCSNCHGSAFTVLMTVLRPELCATERYQAIRLGARGPPPRLEGSAASWMAA